MIYAMADLHGEYDMYREMLEKIRFSKDDTLYVLGDIIDRGPAPVRLLQDMASRDNVFPVMGNHEAMALALLPELMIEVTEENAEKHLNAELMSKLVSWQMDGGTSTISDFGKLNADERADLMDYMSDFPLYETVDAGDKTFVLVHAGIQNFEAGRKMRSYRPEELMAGRHDYQACYFGGNIHIVTGHTPTLALTGRPEIYHAPGGICIDCGASFPGGRLACLCLDTMEEFYI